MTTYVVGFRPPDEKWNRMRDAWKACEAASIPTPREVSEFFDFNDPSDKPGMEVALGAAVTEYDTESESGYEVDLTKLPPDVKVLRFYNSY
jgi:hypothetical protein